MGGKWARSPSLVYQGAVSRLRSQQYEDSWAIWVPGFPSPRWALNFLPLPKLPEDPGSGLKPQGSSNEVDSKVNPGSSSY